MNLTGGGPYAKMIARAWADEKFMNLLRSKPKHAMAEMGIDVPQGVDIVVVEDTPQKVHVVVREKPSRNEMSDQDLNKLTWAYESNSGPSGGSRMATCD